MRDAKWNEINFEKAEWKTPVERMKMAETHIVPLAKQVIELLKELHCYTGHCDFLFPSPRTFTRPIRSDSLVESLRVMRYT